jgi:hypothetical protein
MGWLDNLIAYAGVSVAGVLQAKRSTLNFVSGATAADNPGTNSTDVTIAQVPGSAIVFAKQSFSGDSDQVMNASLQAASVIAFNVGGLTATRNVTALLGLYGFMVWNNTTGGHSIQIIGSTGSGATVPNGKVVFVWSDGTNYYAGPTN